CAASAALVADWLGVIGAVAGVPRGLKVLFIIGFPRVCASWPAIRHLTPFARARPGQIWYRLTVATRLPGARPICDAMAQMRPSYAATSRGGAAAGDAAVSESAVPVSAFCPTVSQAMSDSGNPSAC